jgi:hypothetical protein
VNTNILVEDLCHLDEFTTDSLQELSAEYSLSENLTVPVYHFGWSQLEKCFMGFVYRSERNFQSERLRYGTGIKPHFEHTDWVDNDKIDFVKIIKRQRLLDRQRPPDKQVGIGGDIYMLHMSQNGTSITQLHRFEDYDDEYIQMMKNLSK